MYQISFKGDEATLKAVCRIVGHTILIIDPTGPSETGELSITVHDGAKEYTLGVLAGMEIPSYNRPV